MKDRLTSRCVSPFNATSPPDPSSMALIVGFEWDPEDEIEPAELSMQNELESVNGCCNWEGAIHDLLDNRRDP